MTAIWLMSVMLVSIAFSAVSAVAEERPKVVATFSILGDMTHQIGGDLIDLTVLVVPGADAHLFDPRPSDVRQVAGADLLIANGLGFEEFIPGLVSSASFDGTVIEVSAGIAPLLFADDDGTSVPDPHAWHDPANARKYAGNIASALIAADPENAAIYETNVARYLAEIDAVDLQIQGLLGEIPPNSRKILTSHDAFGYLGTAYDLDLQSVVGFSTGDDPSAGDIATLISEIRAGGARVLFVETNNNPGLLEQISSETGAHIGGELYSDSLSDPGGPAATYLDLMRHNAATIATGLLGG
jgi:zinc/manganese transport system substrate-binding protein